MEESAFLEAFQSDDKQCECSRACLHSVQRKDCLAEKRLARSSMRNNEMRCCKCGGIG